MADSSPDDFHVAPQAADFADALDPFALFDLWFQDAAQHEINDPDAMSLATVDARGQPNVRMVLLKGADERGFVFYSNSESAKGGELDDHPFAALCIYWKSLKRQVRARGPVSLVGREEADAYFATRARGSQIGAWASRQSQPLAKREQLKDAIAAETERFEGGEVARPPFWNGYRVAPLSIEFWHDRPFRLHDRLLFTRPALHAPWTRTRLYP